MDPKDEIVENPVELEAEIVDESPQESVEETVRRSILEVGANVEERDAKNEEKANLQGDKGSEETKPAAKEESEATKAAKTLAALKNRAKTGPKRVVEAKDLEAPPERQAAPAQKERLDPPQRFPVEKKEWFNKQPRVLQEQITKDWQEFEGQYTKTFQNAARYEAQAKNVAQELGSSLDIIKINAPKWAKRGVTPAQALAESTQLIDDVVSDPLSAIHDLCQKTGVTAQQLYDFAQSGGKVKPVQQQPQNVGSEKKYLTEEDLPKYWEKQQQQIQQNATIQELARLQNTVTQDGKYVYPELHDADSIERLQPLTVRARKNQPGGNWTDWTKQAITWDRQIQNPGLPSSGSVGLSLGNPDISKIKQATLSTKQRGAPSVPTIANGKANEKMDDTVRRSIAEVRAKYGN